MKPLQMRSRFAMTSIGALLAAMLLAGCGDDSNSAAPEAAFDDSAADARVEQVLAETKRYEELAKSPDGGVAALIQKAQLAGGSLVIVPAGSVDALAGALASADNGGIVLLKSGLHTESASVLISKTVNLIGEPGAILEVDTDPFPVATFNEPGLHVKNAPRVLIWGIDLRPKQTSGNTAILLENAPFAQVGFCKIRNHQVSVLLHQSDRVTIYGNAITAAPDGFYGIEVVNGEHCALVSNDIAGAPAFGVFACDKNGTMLFNHIHGSFVGLIFCKVPMGDAILPGGEVIGAELPATDWIAKWNNCTDNQWGYLAIDGATGCRMINNDASNNAAYDVELAGDSERFGFFTPTSSNCTAIINKPQIVVKNCGLNSTVIGGTQVDTTSDPCF